MNKTKLSILLLITAVLLLFSSCGNMMVESDDISIDLSSVVSKDLTNQYAKIRLVAVGTNNFFELPETEAFQPIKDGTVSLTNIPVGPDYTIYLSVGDFDESTKVFKVSKAINGEISVTGGATTDATLKVSSIMASPIDFFTGKALKGAAVIDGVIHSVSADGTKLFYGTAGDFVNNPDSDNTFNSVTAGYDNKAIISMKSKDGEGFTTFKSSNTPPLDIDYANALPAEIEGDDKSIDVISADVFWDDTEELELVVGQTEGGLVLHVQDFTDGEEFEEWMLLDLGPYLAEAGLELKGKMIDSISVIKKYSGVEVSELWVFMASQVGDFRIMLPLAADGFDLTPEGDETEMDAIMKLFEPFKADNALAERYILGMTTTDINGKPYLFIGTDLGLYKAEPTDLIASMNPTVVAAEGNRVEMLKGGSNYTACVTALELIILRNSDNATASISFNEGLPVSELLNDGAVTGMDWNGNVLYVAGNYGLVSINAAELF